MPATSLHRVEVRSKSPSNDPRSGAVRAEAAALGLPSVPSRIDCASVYLIEGDLSVEDVRRLADELLSDPVLETAEVTAQGEAPVAPAPAASTIEIHPLPGVMDPDAEAVELAIRALLGREANVRTGIRYDFHGVESATARAIAERALANRVIHAIHDAPFLPASFPVGHQRPHESVEVPIRDLPEEALERLSREAHLFLDLAEMKAIQSEYRKRGCEPRDIELETLAQTWSEHCVHKTLKARVRYSGPIPATATGDARPRHETLTDGTVVIHNLLAATVAAATHELIAGGVDWCLSVFKDNSGVIAFDDEHAVCFKVETHNHPSAIEPYGGAATGIGGCIRDVMGTGLGAKPIAATDSFCVAHPDHFASPAEEPRGGAASVKSLPAGCLPPARILRQVVAGVRDYGNRMGIPTVNGLVWFDDDYVGNPLVYCGVVGVLPRSCVSGAAKEGDLIVALGGRTGRDGIHGATFSSAELTDTHADEFSHAVQIGNAVTEKMTLDAILEARDAEGGPLFHAITDCGAGGFSSAVGEMGQHLGATVDLENAPLKYAGLTPTEVWISEAQERMVLAVAPARLEELRTICAGHNVELCVLGGFGADSEGRRDLVLRWNGRELGRLSMAFLHEGIPGTERIARWSPRERSFTAGVPLTAPAPGDALLALLAHPNIASKHWIVRQYDHEVQGGTVVRPLVGPNQQGPGDATVITPVDGSSRGLAIGCGLATGWRDDPYLMALAAIDECVRNLVCVGADPGRIAILDNFCWPSCRRPENLGDLVRAAEGCYDGALAYRTPFISGKDSLNNQFVTEAGTTIQIPPTLLISGFGIVDESARAITMDAKDAGNLLLIVGRTGPELGGSHFAMRFGLEEEFDRLPAVDLHEGPRTAQAVHRLIASGVVRSAHDCSDGGMLVAAAEMALAGGLGLVLDTAALPSSAPLDDRAELFAETPGRYLLEVRRGDLPLIDALLGDVPYAIIGEFDGTSRLEVSRRGISLTLDELTAAWRGTLDW